MRYALVVVFLLLAFPSAMAVSGLERMVALRPVGESAAFVELDPISGETEVLNAEVPRPFFFGQAAFDAATRRYFYLAQVPNYNLVTLDADDGAILSVTPVSAPISVGPLVYASACHCLIAWGGDGSASWIVGVDPWSGAATGAYRYLNQYLGPVSVAADVTPDGRNMLAYLRRAGGDDVILNFHVANSEAELHSDGYSPTRELLYLGPPDEETARYLGYGGGYRVLGYDPQYGLIKQPPMTVVQSFRDSMFSPLPFRDVEGVTYNSEAGMAYVYATNATTRHEDVPHTLWRVNVTTGATSTAMTPLLLGMRPAPGGEPSLPVPEVASVTLVITGLFATIGVIRRTR